MISVILISQQSVISKIFTLICNKLSIDLTIVDTNYIKQEADLIIVDQEFIDDHFNLIKQYSQKLGAITSQDLPFEKAKDFIIPRPFLPSQLETILLEQIDIIEKNKEHEKQYLETHDIQDTQQIDPAVSYLEDLADTIVDDINEQPNDESIVHFPKDTKIDKEQETVLDSQELSKLQNMLEVNDDFFKKINITSPQDLSKEDWIDLADIIDKAIDDVKDYEFDHLQENETTKTIQLVLNKFAMKELRPLLQKLDQSIIDNLVDGNDINLHITLKD